MTGLPEPPVLPELICPHCGIANPTATGRCWVCHLDRVAKNPYGILPAISAGLPNATDGTSPAQQRTQGVYWFLLLGCMVLLVLVGIGVGAQDPGVMLTYLIIISPACLMTLVRAMQGLATRKGVQPQNLLLTFILSGAVTAIVLMLLIIAAVIALIVWCFAVLFGANPGF